MAQNFESYPKFAKAIANHPKWPRAMCFGDSWFQYPGAKLIDIQKQLPRIFEKTLFFNEGVAGRDSKSYKQGRDRVARALGDYQFNVLLLSMGGNDIVGEELREFVKRKEDPQNIGSRQWGVIPPQVRDHVRLSAFEAALDFLRDDFVEMIERRDAHQPDCEVVVHDYAYIWPNNKPFKLGPIKAGPWVHPFLKDVGLPDIDDQRIVTCWLMDQFWALLSELASQFPRVRAIDAREALPKPASWDNEIHPKGPGFKHIATKYWAPALGGVLK
jgi:hypothetical protein